MPHSILTFHNDEKVLFVIRKHWFVMLSPILISLALTVAGIVLLLILVSIDGSVSFIGGNNFDLTLLRPLLYFVFPLYIMTILLVLFIKWMDYYLDMWVITDKRVIDIEQSGLFSREMAEIPMYRVQDVTMEVHGIIQTFLRFGTIRIQTAGEREFLIHHVPRLREVKDAILTHARQNKKQEIEA